MIKVEHKEFTIDGQFVGYYYSQKLECECKNIIWVKNKGSTNKRSLLYTNREDCRKQMLMLNKGDFIHGYGAYKFSKKLNKMILFLYSVMKYPVPAISLKDTTTQLDIEYQKIADQLDLGTLEEEK